MCTIRSDSNAHSYGDRQPISHRDADCYFDANSYSYGYSNHQSNTYRHTNNNSYAE